LIDILFPGEPSMSTRDPRPRDAVGLRLELSQTDRDRLLVAAAKAGKSMASYLREIVVEHMDEIEDREIRKRQKKGKG
jgi:predicted DNA-binding protein